MNKDLKLSESGRALIKDKEVFSSTWYLCPAKKMTIGWGHVKESGDNFNHIDENRGNELLDWDCKEAIDCIKKYVKVPLTQNQFDALVVFVFNIGIGAFQTSTVLRKLNAGDLLGSAKGFALFNKITVKGKKQVCNGLVKRRAEEAALFLKL